MNLITLLRHFLRRHADSKRPLLLALSGGVDSLCLYYLLRECRSLVSELHVAHVDHRWRVGSKEEAEWLRDLVVSQGIPFYLKTLDPNQLSGNLEDACRQKRIDFLVECAQDIGAQAVMLGHHADDQAETVLKRVFEGAPLSKMTAIKQISQQKGIPVWRPLLSVPKGKILEWMTTQGYEWIEDCTNSDPQYLRAKMRRHLIPWLSEEFGKNISPPLCRLAAELEEVEGYLKKQTAKYTPQKVECSGHVTYDFTKSLPSDPLEWKTLIRTICDQESFPISRSQLYDIVRLLIDHAADKWIESAGKRVRVHCGRLIFSAQK